MFKTLYEEGFLDIEKILIREYEKLNLQLLELTVLLFLFDCYKNKIFSSLNLAKKANLSKNEVESVLDELIKKNFFSLSQDKKNDRIVEVFNLDPTFLKIEKIYLEKIKKTKEKQQNIFISETIEILEKNKGCVLTSYELEIIRSWYLDKKFTHQDIIKAIQIAKINQKTSFQYIERILNQKNLFQLNKDDKADKILHKIFKKIK